MSKKYKTLKRKKSIKKWRKIMRGGAYIKVGSGQDGCVLLDSDTNDIIKVFLNEESYKSELDANTLFREVIDPTSEFTITGVQIEINSAFAECIPSGANISTVKAMKFPYGGENINNYLQKIESQEEFDIFFKKLLLLFIWVCNLNLGTEKGKAYFINDFRFQNIVYNPRTQEIKSIDLGRSGEVKSDNNYWDSKLNMFAIMGLFQQLNHYIPKYYKKYTVNFAAIPGIYEMGYPDIVHIVIRVLNTLFKAHF